VPTLVAAVMATAPPFLNADPNVIVEPLPVVNVLDNVTAPLIVAAPEADIVLASIAPSNTVVELAAKVTPPTAKSPDALPIVLENVTVPPVLVTLMSPNVSAEAVIAALIVCAAVPSRVNVEVPSSAASINAIVVPVKLPLTVAVACSSSLELSSVPAVIFNVVNAILLLKSPVVATAVAPVPPTLIVFEYTSPVNTPEPYLAVPPIVNVPKRAALVPMAPVNVSENPASGSIIITPSPLAATVVAPTTIELAEGRNLAVAVLVVPAAPAAPLPSLSEAPADPAVPVFKVNVPVIPSSKIAVALPPLPPAPPSLEVEPSAPPEPAAPEVILAFPSKAADRVTVATPPAPPTPPSPVLAPPEAPTEPAPPVTERFPVIAEVISVTVTPPPAPPVPPVTSAPSSPAPATAPAPAIIVTFPVIVAAPVPVILVTVSKPPAPPTEPASVEPATPPAPPAPEVNDTAPPIAPSISVIVTAPPTPPAPPLLAVVTLDPAAPPIP